MKYALLCLGLMLAAPATAQQKPALLRGQLALPEFAALADKASETVNVTLDPNILGMACRFLSTEDPEEAKAKKVCTSLRGVYVRHFTFDSDFAYPKADIDRVVRQLSGPGWSQLVDAKSKKENTDVKVYVLIDGEKAQGLSIIASQPREFTIVNVVGSIDLEQLHDLKNLGVPDLEIEKSAPAPKPVPKPAPKPAPKAEPKSAPKTN
jgi:hypothetical protein